jgi:hypothetical protein
MRAARLHGKASGQWAGHDARIAPAGRGADAVAALMGFELSGEDRDRWVKGTEELTKTDPGLCGGGYAGCWQSCTERAAG